MTTILSKFTRIRATLPLTRQVQSLSTQPVVANSVVDALALLKSQPSHYVIASLVGKRLILTPRDLVTVPRLRDVDVGDTLQLNAIEELGSREYTLRGSPYVPTSVASVTATVVEHTKGLMQYIVKKKRRKGYKRTIQHKQTYTRLRINDIKLGDH